MSFHCESVLGQTRRTAIALVTGGADRELSARLQAEFRALGWRVLEVHPGSELALAQIARRARTLAVLRVGQAAEGIEVWVAPEVDAEAKSEWVDVDARRPELAVVLAVEALRGRFLEFGLEPEHSASAQKVAIPAAPSPLPRRTAAPTESRSTKALGPSLWLEAGAAAVAAGAGVTPSLELAFHFLPRRWFGFDVAAWWPLSRGRVEGAGGAADVKTSLAFAAGELRWDLENMILSAGGGVGLAHVAMEGQPTSGYLGRQDSVLTTLPFGRLSWELPLWEGFSLRLATHLGASAPRAVVRFDEKVVASWGRPFLAMSLGLQGRLLGDLL